MKVGILAVQGAFLEHRKMLEENYPERFTVRHKIFLTWYRMHDR